MPSVNVSPAARAALSTRCASPAALAAHHAFTTAPYATASGAQPARAARHSAAQTTGAIEASARAGVCVTDRSGRVERTVRRHARQDFFSCAWTSCCAERGDEAGPNLHGRPAV